MDNAKLSKLLELVSELVGEGKPWKEKRDMLLAEASEDDKTNLMELVGWFDEPVI